MVWNEAKTPIYEANGLPEGHFLSVQRPTQVGLNKRTNPWIWTAMVSSASDDSNEAVDSCNLEVNGVADGYEEAKLLAEKHYLRLVSALSTIKES